MATTRKYTEDLLQPLVAEAASVADVLRLLGLRQNGGAHAHISKTIKAFGIDTSHFRPFDRANIPHRRSSEQILTRLPADHRREKPHLLKRALLEIGRPHRCECCGNEGTWQGLPLTLEVDHIDGDFLNNLAENLRFLCPNCHRQTANFAGRSRGHFTTNRGALEATPQA